MRPRAAARSMASLSQLPAGLSGQSRRAAHTRWAVSFLLGLLSVAGLPPLSVWPVFFVTLSGLVLVLDGVGRLPEGRRLARVRAAGACGWWFGFGYFLAGLYWIGFAFLVEADKFAWLLPVAITALPAGLALFFALGTGIAMLSWSPGAGRVLALAAALGATEWLRGNVLTGFPWNSLGMWLAGSDYLLQSASLIGMTGLSFVAVAVFALPAACFGLDAQEAWPRRLWPLAASAGLLAAMFAFGVWRLSIPEPPPQSTAKLRIVQPNIPQAEKWEGANRQRIFQTFLDLSQRNAAGELAGFDGISHVIWPESSLPFLMLQSPEALKAIGEMLPGGVTLVTGSLRVETNADGSLVQKDGLLTVYNDVAALDDSGALMSSYDKIHLVPFGEYLPAQQTLEAIGLEQLTRLKGGFTAGRGPRELAVPGLPPGVPLVCYEVIFPEEIAPAPGQTWLLNLTNDAWFGVSSGPHQHLLQARLRAVELGLPVIRVANTGISAVIGARGEIMASLPLGARGSIEAELPGAMASTLYRRFGDLGGLLILMLLCLLLFASRQRSHSAASG